MATRHIESFHNMYDTHHTLSASLEDFENSDQAASPRMDLPSHHSGFKLEDSEVESNSDGPWSPQAFRRPDTSNAWFRHQPGYQGDSSNSRSAFSPSKSRETSPQYEDALEEDDYTLAANIPLPRGSVSPVKERSASPPPSLLSPAKQDFAQPIEQPEDDDFVPANPNNCMPKLQPAWYTHTDYYKIFALLYEQRYNKRRNHLNSPFRGCEHM